MGKVKWTYEKCMEIAKQYNTVTSLEKENRNVYRAMLKNNWLNDPLLKWENRKKILWTYEEAEEIAKQYKSRTEFALNNKSLYNVCWRNNWLDKFYWMSSPETYNIRSTNYTIYTYEFSEYNAVYVGLTNNLKRRKWEHKTRPGSTVFKFLKENNIEYKEPIIIQENLTAINACELEEKTIEQYKNNNWKILNKKKTGIGSSSLGGVCSNKFWTKEKIIEIAKLFSNYNELYEIYPSAIKKAKQYKIYNDLKKLFKI